MAGSGSAWTPEFAERFTAIFHLYDLDGSGTIDRDEYAHLLDRIAKVKEGRPAGLSRNAFLFHRFDLNNDGFISLDEFLGGIEDVGTSTSLDFAELADFLAKGPSKKSAKKKAAGASPASTSNKTSASPVEHLELSAPHSSSKKSAPPTIALPPELEGKYKLVTKVGKGGFAIVYKAHNIPDAGKKPKTFAVKVVDFNAMNGGKEGSEDSRQSRSSK